MFDTFQEKHRTIMSISNVLSSFIPFPISGGNCPCLSGLRGLVDLGDFADSLPVALHRGRGSASAESVVR